MKGCASNKRDNREITRNKIAEEIENKGDRAVNLDDARKLEELAIELMRVSRDTLVCCS